MSSRRAHLAAWLAVALVSALFGRACGGEGCCCDPTTYIDRESDETSGPVRARIVVERGWSVSRGSVWRDRTPVLVIADAPERRLPLLRCEGDALELEPDGDGSRIAYRCTGSGPFRVVYRRNQLPFEHCALDAPTAADGGSVDWSRVPRWAAVSADLLRCEADSPTALDATDRARAHRGPAAIFSAERAVAGEAGVARLLVRARDIPLRLMPCGCDAWLDAARATSGGARATVLAALSGGATDPRASASRAWRALVLRGLEGSDDDITAAIQLARQRLSAPRVSSPTSTFVRTPPQPYALAAAAVLSRRLVRTRPQSAGAMACELLGASHAMIAPPRSFTSGYGNVHLLLVIAASRTSCPATARNLFCGPQVECDGGPCTNDVLAAEVASALAADPVGAVWTPTHGSPDPQAAATRAAFAAASLGNAIPAELARKIARRRYPMTPSEGPMCRDLPAAAEGQPCRCSFAQRWPDTACALDPTLTVVSHEHFCRLEIDDEARIVRQVRAACLPAWRDCERDDQCCPGNVCTSRLEGSATRLCQPPLTATPPVAPR
ncbi:MAG: hypothetical protein IT379_25620 [Deltaproteobacteria bacterium]|nr:hypothetical protein [Deltaproteobacteria bacterium]